jgi:N6-L-threonylcarbamoyladenine synthase
MVDSKFVNDVAASFQEAVCDILVAKTIYAAITYQVETIVVTGGVSANERLHKKMAAAAKVENKKCIFPYLSLTGDNAAMIGIVACLKAKNNGFDDINKLEVKPKVKWSFY